MPTRKSLSPIEEAKELLAESKFRLKFYDFMREKSGDLVTNTSEEFFSVNTPWKNEEFASRLKRYEDLSSDLITIMSLIGAWGTADHLLSASLPAKQFALQLGPDSRKNHWTALRWYPVMLLTYALGINAVANNNYAILFNFLDTSVKLPQFSLQPVPLALAIVDGFSATYDFFKTLPGHERNSVPCNEYLFDFFNGKLKDAVLLGDDYEDFFDRLEIIFAFQAVHSHDRILSGYGWLPPGRFEWKYSRRPDSSPLKQLCNEASQKKETWGPIKAGFFDGSYERFDTIVQEFTRRL